MTMTSLYSLCIVLYEAIHMTERNGLLTPSDVFELYCVHYSVSVDSGVCKSPLAGHVSWHLAGKCKKVIQPEMS